MIDQSFDEIYNDDSLENKAKAGATEYFKTHQILNKEELNSFLSIIGLDTIWSTKEEKLTIWELFIKNSNNNPNDTVNETSVQKGIEELFHSDNISLENSSFCMNESSNNSFRLDDCKDKDKNNQSKLFKEPEEIIIEEQLSPRSSMNNFFNSIDTQTLRKFKSLNIILLLYDGLTQEKISELLAKFKFISLPYDQVVGYIKLFNSNNNSENQFELTMKIDKEILNHANETIDNLLEEDKKANHNSLKRLNSNDHSMHYFHKNSYTSNNAKEEDSKELIDKIKKIDNESLDCITAIKLLLELPNQENRKDNKDQISTKAEVSFLLAQLFSIIKAKISKLSQENSKTLFIEINKNSMFHNTLNQYTKSKNNLYAMIDLEENLNRIVKSNQILIDELNKKNDQIKALNAKIADQNVQLLVNQSHISQLEEFTKEMQKENYELKEDLSKATARYSTIILNKKESNDALVLDNIKGIIQDLEAKNRKCNETICKKNLEFANLKKELSNLIIQCNYLKEENKRLSEFDLCRTDSISYLHEQLFTNNRSSNKISYNKKREDSLSDILQRKKSLSMPKGKITTRNNKEFDDAFIPYDNISENEMKQSKEYTYQNNNTTISGNNPNASIVSMANKSDKSIMSSSAYGGGGRKRRKTKSQWAFNNEKENRNWDDITNSRIDIFSVKESYPDKGILETTSYNIESYADSEIDLSRREREKTHRTNVSEKITEENPEDNLISDIKETPVSKGTLDISNINGNSLIEESNFQESKENIFFQNNKKDDNGNNTIREDEDEDKTISEQASQYHFFNSNRNSSATYNSNQVKDKQSNTIASMRSSRLNNGIDSLSSFPHFKDNLLLGDLPAYDFLNLRNSKLLDSVLFKIKDTIIPVELFSDCVYYFQENLKKIKSILIITSKFFYIFREYDFDCKVRINRKYMGPVSISSKYFNGISFHFNTGEDVLIDIYRRMELLYYLRDLNKVKKFNKLRFKFTDHFTLGTKIVNIFKEKIFQITPNFENVQKMGYLYKYNDTFFSNSFTDKYVVLSNIGLLYFDNIAKPPERIIPIIGTKIKTVVCNTETKHYYCFQLTLVNNETITFGSLIKEELESWIVELRTFKTVYKQKMKGIDTVQK